MAWLLDTNAWIIYLKMPQSSIRSRLETVSPAEVVLCSVVKAELLHGAQKYGNRERRLAILRELLHHTFRCLSTMPPPRNMDEFVMGWRAREMSSARTT